MTTQAARTLPPDLALAAKLMPSLFGWEWRDGPGEPTEKPLRLRVGMVLVRHNAPLIEWVVDEIRGGRVKLRHKGCRRAKGGKRWQIVMSKEQAEQVMVLAGGKRG